MTASSEHTSHSDSHSAYLQGFLFDAEDGSSVTSVVLYQTTTVNARKYILRSWPKIEKCEQISAKLHNIKRRWKSAEWFSSWLRTDRQTIMVEPNQFLTAWEAKISKIAWVTKHPVLRASISTVPFQTHYSALYRLQHDTNYAIIWVVSVWPFLLSYVFVSYPVWNRIFGCSRMAPWLQFLFTSMLDWISTYSRS